MVDPGMVVDLFKETRHRRTAPLVLELDLTDGLVEVGPADPLSAFVARRRAHLRDVLDGLRRARSDSRVRALIVKAAGGTGLAMAQELHEAIRGFRDAGKLTVAWAETFGEDGRGTVPYYLATACEQIMLQPTGDVGLTGAALEEPFLRGALDKAGITPQFAKRHEYKTMANTFMEHGYTPEHEEMSQRLVASVGEQVCDTVATARGLTVETVRRLIDRGPLSAAEALEAGLVDRLAYRDEVYASVKARVSGVAATGDGARDGDGAGAGERAGERAGDGAGDGPLLRYVTRYNRAHSLASRLPRPGQDVVALINGQGQIRLGRSGRGSMPGQSHSMGSDTVGAAFRAAVRDERVRAIVFRVNSPGGSAVASDAIWREVVLAGRAGKPVIVSMGNVAASGGYYVAMAADTIVAQPGTITGSIGVVIGKAVLRELLERVGIGLGTVQSGDHARMYSTTREFSDGEWERINSSLDRIYDDFVEKAAHARGKTREEMHDLARGRVWTGADAAERGLVDALGGLDHAMALARKKAGLPADAPVRTYPHLTPMERMRPPESSDDRTAASARFDAWGPLTAVAARLGLPAGGPLLLPGDWEFR